jgi:hypothetical protein
MIWPRNLLLVARILRRGLSLISNVLVTDIVFLGSAFALHETKRDINSYFFPSGLASAMVFLSNSYFFPSGLASAIEFFSLLGLP